MKFVAVEEIAAPIEQVWPHVADFEGLEAAASARLGAIARTPPGPAGPGTTWQADADIMGRSRDIAATLTELDRPDRFVVEATLDGIAVTLLVELAEKAPGLTRLTVTTEARADTIAGRLLLQSARLLRQKLENRYVAQVTSFAATVEDNVGG